jgi:hypothetical protein
MVTRLDRLARSARDLLNTLGAIADRKAGFGSLGDTWADPPPTRGHLCYRAAVISENRNRAISGR